MKFSGLKLYCIFPLALFAVMLFFGCTQIEPGDQIACTMEAKLCSDGSYVGRSGPNCEFAPCPDEPNCNCPEGYVQDGDVCNPQCYYSEPPCLAPSIMCNQQVQIANPASVNCIDNNGTLEIVDTPQGQVGMCTLPSGKVCEEWAYFREECTE